MAAEAVAGALDADDDSVVQQAVEECGGHDGVAEDLGLFGDAAVGDEDHGAALIARVDQLEERAAASTSSVRGMRRSTRWRRMRSRLAGALVIGPAPLRRAGGRWPLRVHLGSCGLMT